MIMHTVNELQWFRWRYLIKTPITFLQSTKQKNKKMVKKLERKLACFKCAQLLNKCMQIFDKSIYIRFDFVNDILSGDDLMRKLVTPV